MADRVSLVAPNALPVTRAVDVTDAAQLDAPTEVIRTVKDPARAPAALLPWLALERRVTDLWVPGLTVAQQRAVIAAQYGILRRAGTPKGLADALALLGVGATYDEWYEYGGDPYFIRLKAAIGGTMPWTAAVDAQVYRVAVRYKNRRTAIGDYDLTRTMPAGGAALACLLIVEDVLEFPVTAPDLDPPAATPRLGLAVLIADVLVFGGGA